MLLHSMAPLHAAAAAQHAAVGAAPNAAPKKSGSSSSVPAKLDSRRAFLQGVMIAVAAGAGTVLGHVDAAPAASKRRAPPPTEEKEKKDPNMSGVQAKVMASRKRKEAMKEATAKLREKGKKPADAAAPTAVTKTQIKSAAAVVVE